MFRLLLGFTISYFISSNIFAVSAADEFTTILNNTRTMVANFKQDDKISGSMTIVRPGKFRWDITQPNKQLIIINKNQLTIYDIDLEQIIKRKMNYNNPGNPAMLLSGDIQVLRNTFKIVKLNKITSSKDIWFELIPKNKKTDYQKIQMHFIAGKLVAMNIVNSLEQKSTIKFSNIYLDTKIKPSNFVLNNIPSDVDIVNE